MGYENAIKLSGSRDETGCRKSINRILRVTIFLLFFIWSLSDRDIQMIFRSALSDAFLQVSVFVAFTLYVVFALEMIFSFDLGIYLKKSKTLQSPISSLLGALPGCGGAIIVVTQYTRGYISFGSVVAVLIATMGDAAFLLLAKEPYSALIVISLGIVTGSISGWVVDYIHGQDYLRETTCEQNQEKEKEIFRQGKIDHYLSLVFVVIFIPGLVFGILLAMQVDVDNLIFASTDSHVIQTFGTIGGLLCILMWIVSTPPMSQVSEINYKASLSFITFRTLRDTIFVTSWVVMGFIGFELAMYLFDANLESWTNSWTPLLPLIAIVIGFIPGCGPQIITTSLYLAGVIPFSAQIGNAISNDGDALFPAIALAPKAAFYATLYSTIPALILSYAYYFLVELPH